MTLQLMDLICSFIASNYLAFRLALAKRNLVYSLLFKKFKLELGMLRKLLQPSAQARVRDKPYS